MRSIVRTGLVSAVAAGMLAAGGMTASASAQPIALNNLVSVQISNLVNNNNIAVNVPVNAAATICGVDVEVVVLAEANDALETVTCSARGNQSVSLDQAQ